MKIKRKPAATSKSVTKKKVTLGKPSTTPTTEVKVDVPALVRKVKSEALTEIDRDITAKLKAHLLVGLQPCIAKLEKHIEDALGGDFNRRVETEVCRVLSTCYEAKVMPISTRYEVLATMMNDGWRFMDSIPKGASHRPEGGILMQRVRPDNPVEDPTAGMPKDKPAKKSKKGMKIGKKKAVEPTEVVSPKGKRVRLGGKKK